MGYLKKFGYEIFRLREAQEVNEYILFCCFTTGAERKNVSATDKKIRGNWYEFKKNKLIEVIIKDIMQRDIDLIGFIREEILKESDGNKLRRVVKIKEIVSEWVESEYILLDNLGYIPTDQIIYEENDKTYLNVYKKPKLYDLKPIKPIKKNFSFPNILKLLLHLVDYDKKSYTYVCNWLSWKIKHPTKRLPTALIFISEPGAGKNTFASLVLRGIFEKNFREIGQAAINSEYNDYMEGMELIVANEVIHNDNKYLVPDKLKSYVTEEYIDLRRKFKPCMFIRNYCNWIFFSNNLQPLKIDVQDRRYSVFSSKTLPDNTIIDVLRKNLDKELYNFFSYLLSLEPEYIYVGKPIETEAKTEIVLHGLNSVEYFYTHCQDYGDTFIGLSSYYKSINEKDNTLGQYINTIEVFNRDSERYLRVDDIYKLYKFFCNSEGLKPFGKPSFCRILHKFSSLNSEQIRFSSGVFRVIKLKDEKRELKDE